MSKPKYDYNHNGHAMILRGKKGQEIFDYIVSTAPTIPYEKLREGSERCHESLRKDREFAKSAK